MGAVNSMLCKTAGSIIEWGSDSISETFGMLDSYRKSFLFSSRISS